MPDPAAEDPHRNLFKPPFTACWPQVTEVVPLPSPAIPGPISIRPTSRPSIYPAEKLMAEKRTTTPALTTHVITVGLLTDKDSFSRDRRLFLDAAWFPAPLGELDRRFLGAGAASEGYEDPEMVCFFGTGPAVVLCAAAGASSSLLSIADSGTNRKEDGCCLGSGDNCWDSDLGKPRAAAAQESKVERLARRAAS